MLRFLIARINIPPADMARGILPEGVTGSRGSCHSILGQLVLCPTKASLLVTWFASDPVQSVPALYCCIPSVTTVNCA